MNYPVWDLHWTGGGFWIALIAVVHVYVSHFAVGGGLWLVLTERKGYREESAPLLDYVRAHSKFFLLLTMVFGALTGVGIWWTIALLNPAATSTLIHTFVFGWATEWVCFTGEIVALFIYFYTFGKMNRRDHQIVGWLYFVFAWLSLVLIGGIISFMLTPGKWLETHNFWDGFFNPTFLSSVAFRTFLSLMIAGMFGFITAVFIGERSLRESMVRYTAKWVLIPLVLMVLSAWWYVGALPVAQRTMILHKAYEITPYIRTFLVLTPLLLVGALVMAIRLPGAVRKPLAFVIVATGLIHMGSFEFIREAGRRPWIIHGYMYSNSVLATEVDGINASGLLPAARWTAYDNVTDENRLAAGREIFRIECAACHSIGGPLNDILPLTKNIPVLGVDALLNGQGKLSGYMPPFFGTDRERWALASYITEELHESRTTPPAFEPGDTATEIPPFAMQDSEYVLLAWNNLGMHCISDSDPWFVILPPANDLHAQLIRRGETPEVVEQGVELSYAVEEGFEHPEDAVPFWQYARQTFEVELEPGVGLSGNRVSGTMQLDDTQGVFRATIIPVVPYRAGRFNPYPLFTIEARDTETGELLASTRAVAPTSTEMGCQRCHGGGWRVDDVAGITDATAVAILAAHDKRSGTDLLARARHEEPRLCQSCHADPILAADGDPDRLNLSAAIHGWHANYLSDRGAEACTFCHPAGRDGATRCLRGGHSRNLDCSYCHGTLEDHALSLLKPEYEAGKPSAARLMEHLRARTAASVDEINPRVPWLNEPDCLTCHQDFSRPDRATASAFNVWTSGADELYRNRSDESELLQCQACHGSTHATYPTYSDHFGADRDNIQPLQYQGNRRPIGAAGNCKVCHTIDMEDSIHHENMERLD